jgi:hypothetical protein
MMKKCAFFGYLAGFLYLQIGMAGSSSLEQEDNSHPHSCIRHVEDLREFLSSDVSTYLYSNGEKKQSERKKLHANTEKKAEAFDSCLFSKTPNKDAIDYYQLSAHLGAFVDMLDLPKEQLAPIIVRVMEDEFQLLLSLSGRILRTGSI